MSKLYKPYKHLSYTDRQLLDIYLKAKMSITEIAEKIGVHRNTIYREFARSGMNKDSYDAEKAQKFV